MGELFQFFCKLSMEWPKKGVLKTQQSREVGSLCVPRRKELSQS